MLMRKRVYFNYSKRIHSMANVDHLINFCFWNRPVDQIKSHFLGDFNTLTLERTTTQSSLPAAAHRFLWLTSILITEFSPKYPETSPLNHRLIFRLQMPAFRCCFRINQKASDKCHYPGSLSGQHQRPVDHWTHVTPVFQASSYCTLTKTMFEE